MSGGWSIFKIIAKALSQPFVEELKAMGFQARSRSDSRCGHLFGLRPGHPNLIYGQAKGGFPGT